MLIIKALLYHTRRLAFVLVAVMGALLLVRSALAAAGIWQSHIVLNATYYDVNATTGNPDFPNQNLGTFMSGSSPLMLSGGEVKTFKNNGTDVQSTRLNYRVYPTGSPSGGFTSVNLPFAENLTNPGDQRWATTSAGLTFSLA